MQTKNIIITLLLLAFAGLLTYTVLNEREPNEKQEVNEGVTNDFQNVETESRENQKGISIGEAADIAIEKYGGTVKEVESDHYNGREA